MKEVLGLYMLLSVVLRFLHIASVATLVGGLLYGWLALAPALETLPPGARNEAWEAIVRRWRGPVIAAICALLISGIYNILTNPGLSLRYHILLGIKLLLALHVFAVSFLLLRPRVERRARMMAGTAISGLIIILISAYLRRIH